MPNVHIVSHTHWDREWYHSAGRFRQRLVDLVDELLDDPPHGDSSFLLDGQTSVLSDYLDVKPERKDELTALIRQGRLEAGPWFALADELIPTGEALVRNLMTGRRAMQAFGAEAPPVLYCPDSFGHPAALPTLATGFGFRMVIALRGYGGRRWPAGDSVRWEGPDGSRALLYHFSPSGYETGANLPVAEAEALQRWATIKQDLFDRSRAGHILVMNGADHHARQQDLPGAIAALSRAAEPETVTASSLRQFSDELVVAADSQDLPVIRGELRDSYGYVWTLAGTLGTRADQKRRYKVAERELVRDVEPWAALATMRGAKSRKALTEAAWLPLLLCQPHDTLCGCSIDSVARAMDARIDDTVSQSKGIRADSVFDLLDHDRSRARTIPDEWKPAVVVRNPSPHPRSGIALLTVKEFQSDIRVGLHPDAPPGSQREGSFPALAGLENIQILSERLESELTESPRHYPDADLVRVFDIAVLVPEVAGYGMRCFAQGSDETGNDPASAVSRSEAGDGWLKNQRLSVTLDDEGRTAISGQQIERTVNDLLGWESSVDQGDLYTPSIRGQRFTPQYHGEQTLHQGPLRAALEQQWSFADSDERVDLSMRVSLDADSPFVRLAITGHNSASDHRLRLRISSGIGSPRVFADAMFGTVERAPIEVDEVDRRMETPLATAPLHRYVSLFDEGNETGATFYSDGLTEYEVTEQGDILTTLVRSVGELSRNDLPERPGHAGWPTPTPAAQCHGPFQAELAVMWHGGRTSETVDLVERTADDVLSPLTGGTLRSALHLPAPLTGLELNGAGLSFLSAKESEQGQWLALRCTNLLNEKRDGLWRIGFNIKEARLARIDETPIGELPVEQNSVSFSANPGEVVTILVR